MKKKVLVTGANGQLGKAIQELNANNAKGLDFVFVSKSELDITNLDDLKIFFDKNSFDYVINCAAYTDVEQAEKTPKIAYKVNAEGVKHIAEICLEHNTVLIHISTDYVFDGKKSTPYSEDDLPNPINEYGKSKLAGEQYLQKVLKKYFIIRTSWLYSEFGKNFLKRIFSRLETTKTLTITTSEVGTPTNANDLAECITELIVSTVPQYGIYNYSNNGKATWYDFAEEALRISGKLEQIKLEKTDNYSTFAARPKYSVLDKKKLTTTLQVDILDWKTSLKRLKLFMTYTKENTIIK